MITGDNADLKFVYNEPALIVEDGKRYLVVGDLHVGVERRFRDNGINIYGNEIRMAEKLLEIAGRFNTRRTILLGDIKESVLYPEAHERRSLKSFFAKIEGMDVVVLRGNHDAHLDEIIGMEVMDEFTTRNFAFLHGNKWASDDAIKKRTIVSGHSHVAVSVSDKNGARYTEKAWLIAERGNSKGIYGSIGAEELVVMPAFNELITGTPVGMDKGRSGREGMNPLLKNGVFSYGKARVFGVSGSYYGAVDEIA